ncbi:hypothetical protein M406DRAFT_67713 [Cryphonectria parasitica EP155]|uniref:DUF1996 domain-containing protein n=1 Tax=Cryphonectria parasitica (strain ATCC 38755 / EP155) TaxID=660469 RepID=A0A9P5CU77_CRYP1|nr:uncharacterized protein M406DRAFT_67713 [Cryphonectria parasitica EP155]KAF3771409.1 hypothetical protein M406DRAFT_67713 [Cryphonectria parasitica EP155]
MPYFTLHAALVGSVAARVAHAYTQANVYYDPFMYKNIDPIKFPGEYGVSHMHSFFGSDGVTATTNSSAELQAGCGTTDNPNDLSAYWVPSLVYTVDDGATYDYVPLFRFSAYYNLGETEAEVPIPQNLKMVAGSATATTADESPADAQVQWFCEDDDIDADENGFPSSTCSTFLQTLLYFPQCVNVDTLETEYKSSSYGTTNWCPEGYNSMPQLRFSIRYDLRDALPDGWSGTAPFQLASGNAYSSHGDFIMGWTEESAQTMVLATAAEYKYHYYAVNGDLGNAGDEPTCTATDADPDNGTSDYAESVAEMDSSSTKRSARVPRSFRNRSTRM